MGDLLGLEDNMDGKKYIKFMPSVNGWKAGDDEVTIDKFLLDPNSIKSGWGLIQEGFSPDWHWDDEVGIRKSLPTQRNDGTLLTEDEKLKYKRGFSVDIYTKDLGIRTWSSNAKGVSQGFLSLYTALHPEISKNAGKVAVVEYTGSKAVTYGKGSSRIPEFELKGWRADDSFEATTDTFEETALDESKTNGSVTLQQETEEIPF